MNASYCSLPERAGALLALAEGIFLFHGREVDKRVVRSRKK